MYSAFIFTAKNRQRKKTNLIVVFDKDMHPVLCTQFVGLFLKPLIANNFVINDVSIPFGHIIVGVAQLKRIEKITLERIKGKKQGTNQ